MARKGEFKATKEEVLSDIFRVIEEYGDITQPLYIKHGKYSEFQIKKYFGLWK